MTKHTTVVIMIMIIINNYNNINSGITQVPNTAVDRIGGRADSADLYFGRVPIYTVYILTHARFSVMPLENKFVIVFLPTAAVVRKNACTNIIITLLYYYACNIIIIIIITIL